MNFNVVEILESIVGYKGLPFPGAWIHAGKNTGGYTGKDFDDTKISSEEPAQIQSNKGTTLYKKDLQGNYYFMPVVFVHNKREYEIDCALVSISGKKTIVSTPLVGRKGSVKELISIDDYQISITGAIIGADKAWPEEKLDALNELYNVNEAIELKCALTDVFLSKNDKVVIQEISLPPSAQTEHVQIVELKCVTDCAFELIIG